MKKIEYKYSFSTLIFIALFVTNLVFTGQVLAQGGGSNNSGGGSGSGGGGDQTQDRDRVQEPASHEGEEPIQDRDRDQLQDGSGENCINTGDCDGVPDQDRERLQDSGLHIGDEFIRDQNQLRDRLRDQLEDPSQDKDRDRIRASDLIGLQEVVTAGEAVSDDIANGLGAEIRELARNRNRVEVGVLALIAAQNMIGQEGGQIARLAQEIHSVHRTMTQEEEQIQSRGFLSRFFFGGDRNTATTIQNQLQQNTERMQQIKQYLNDCDCDEQVRTLLQQQVRTMEEEHVRLQQVAIDEVSTWGLFSWRF